MEKTNEIGLMHIDFVQDEQKTDCLWNAETSRTA